MLKNREAGLERVVLILFPKQRLTLVKRHGSGGLVNLRPNVFKLVAVRPCELYLSELTILKTGQTIECIGNIAIPIVDQDWHDSHGIGDEAEDVRVLLVSKRL